ncbi:SRPBCC domain-containing protein [uncultured Tateyamaria sp.]|uniref:SRPBCC family protein n=1 Tax=uncultured Tateyamaria sp. TaxID=455651 RepID=UPI002620B413|nr:SRPBCC domain-containing protein [uncultured Tateyamaria sp.]
MTETVLRKTIFLKAPREQVWAYLTQPEHLAKWFHAPKAPLAEGAPLALFGTKSGDLLIWGKVVTARAPEHLEYTFTVGPMGDAVSTVKWTLREVAGGTELALLHTGLPQGAAAFDLTLALDKGWDDHLMQMRGHIHNNG